MLLQTGCLDNCNIMLKGDNEMITDDKHLEKLFHEHYMNILESSKKPEKIVTTKKILIRNWYYIILSKSAKIILA